MAVKGGGDSDGKSFHATGESGFPPTIAKHTQLYVYESHLLCSFYQQTVMKSCKHGTGIRTVCLNRPFISYKATKLNIELRHARL